MLFLCLCSALVVTAAQLVQDDLTLTRRLGQTVSFSCAGTGQCDYDYIFWYQKKETETFRLILYINRNSGYIGKGYGHPQENDFSPVKGKGWELQIEKVKQDHSASYYCSCRIRGNLYLIFGSGTKLMVTDEQVVKPVVSLYPAASSSLLCVASRMVPPRVRFSWKRQKDNGPAEDVPSAGDEQLELREPGRAASILLLRQPEDGPYKYSCSVQHEGGRVEARTRAELPAPAASCPPSRRAAEPAAVQQEAELVPVDPVQSRYQVKLLCLLYTVLIVKSLVYCCGLSLLRSLRDQGPSAADYSRPH
ncbi:hypothetical protein Q5P01_022949 [Channa striata]|uniref:Ig-like domain-containing protein n=1 Tax=Channa striata TaxID=64152 RepID=A0AA88LRW9_CHASR|nr:hypothetical protein Q5P01_022949 [Channa striata]